MINKNNKTIISNGTIITPFQLLEDKVISIEKGKIIAIEDKKNIFEPAETEVIDAGEGFIVPGFIDIHVHGGEGLYINSERKGAQKKEDIKNPSIEEFLEFNLASGNLIRLVTIAPEMPGAIGLIHWLSEHKIIASAAHSNATYEQVQESIRAGLNHVTHTFNAMKGLDHREPGVVGAALSSPELMTQIIADGIHVLPVVIRILIQTKGIENVVL